MPRQLTSAEELQQESKDKDAIKAEILRIDEELVLYDESGPWRYLEARLENLAAASLNALVQCPVEEVPKYRERLLVVRHLASLPEELRLERARLQEQLDE